MAAMVCQTRIFFPAAMMSGPEVQAKVLTVIHVKYSHLVFGNWSLTTMGAGSSSSLSHEATHASTSSYATPRPFIDAQIVHNTGATCRSGQSPHFHLSLKPPIS